MRIARTLALVVFLLSMLTSAAHAARPEQRHRPLATRLVLSIARVEEDGIFFNIEANGIPPAGWYDMRLTVTTDLPVTFINGTKAPVSGSTLTITKSNGVAVRLDRNRPAMMLKVSDESGVLQPASLDLGWYSRPSPAAAFRPGEVEPYDGGPPWLAKLRLVPIDAEGRYAPFGGDWRREKAPTISYSAGGENQVIGSNNSIQYTSEGLEVFIAVRDGCPAQLLVDAGWGNSPSLTHTYTIDCTKSPSTKRWFGGLRTLVIGVVPAGLIAAAILMVWRWRRK